MENITQSCSNMSVPSGYLYVVLPHALSVLVKDKDCEQAWYNKEGDFLSDGLIHANKTRHSLVIDANRENLTLSKCIDLQHNVTCDGSGLKLHHFYKVFNETEPRSPEGLEQQPSTFHSIGVPIIIAIAVLIGVLLIGVLIAVRYYGKQRVDRWVGGVLERLVRVCWQRDDQNNRPSSDPLESKEGSNNERCPLNAPATEKNGCMDEVV